MTTEGWTLVEEEEHCENVWIQSVSSSAAYVNVIHGSCWNITTKVWNIYNDKIAVVSFVTKAGRKVIIGVKLW
jgi:predicted phosphohydrolase